MKRIKQETEKHKKENNNDGTAARLHLKFLII